jgi:transcriptional regulator with XRE-family HTH domain
VNRTKPRVVAEDYQKIIGDRIRRIRRDRQLTQLDLARQVGVTNGQISTIERGLSAPSIGTLRRISVALAVPLMDFFESSHLRDVQIVRASERRRVTNPIGSEVVDLLADSHSLSAVQVVLDPDQGCVRSGSRENSDLFLFVLDGHIEVNFSGQSYLLRSGDCLQTEGRHKYAIKNIGDSVVSLLEVRSNGAR